MNFFVFLDNKVNLEEVCSGKKVVIFGVPGAFICFFFLADNKVNLEEVCSGKKVVIFGVPGAFICFFFLRR